MFSLDPDFVYDNVSFDTITSIMILNKEQEEYQERYNDIKKATPDL